MEPAATAWVGDDLPGLRPKFAVEVGDHVGTGQVLFVDRKHPEIAFTSSTSGIVTEASYGKARTLSICKVQAESVDLGVATSAPDASAREAPRGTLLARGLWPAFRTRPFGRIPVPDSVPGAIVVNAVQAEPQDPPPAAVLSERGDAFLLGMKILARLTSGPVYLCQSPGDPLCPADGRIVVSSFAGSRAVGLDGTLIDRLCPITGDWAVWSIGYQDVAAIGHLFETGIYTAQRIVSVTGPDAETPRLVRCPLGTRLADLGARNGVGALCDGRDADFLGRHSTRVRLVRKTGSATLTRTKSHSPSRPGALIPTRALETALAVDLLTVPLLRALSVGDVEAAKRLGCLALVEEDVAELSRRCTSGADYAVLLRRVLDELMTDAA